MSGEGHSNNRTARAKLGLVSHDNTGGYFIVECQDCGVVYPSFQCGGGDAIADTGDYNDATCPHCGRESPEECSNVGLAWNTQQLKINELQQRLTVADERADVLVGLLRRSAAFTHDLQNPISLRREIHAALKPEEAKARIQRHECSSCKGKGLRVMGGEMAECPSCDGEGFKP